MAASKKTESILVKEFLQSVGAHLGLYIPGKKSFITGLESTDHYQQNLEQVASFLKKGWKASEISEEIWAAYRRGEKAVRLHEILPDKAPSKKLDERENLLEANFIYQHPALYDRVMPIYSGNAIDGFTRKIAGSNKRKDTFTLKDLAEYYYSSMNVRNTSRTWGAALGAFSWLLGDCRVDEVLTAIDKAKEVDDQTPVIKLADYMRDAREEIRAKEARLGD